MWHQSFLQKKVDIASSSEVSTLFYKTVKIVHFDNFKQESVENFWISFMCIEKFQKLVYVRVKYKQKTFN